MSAPARGGRLPAVVLVHGLLFGAWALTPMAIRLRRCGLAPRCYAWDTRGTRPADAARGLAAVLAAQDAPAVHVVAHSLGGLIAARVVRDFPELLRGRLVLLGTPARGSASARRLARLAPGRWLLGAAADELAAGWPGPAPPGAAHWGLVAGTRAFGAGRALGTSLPTPNDGTVAQAETVWSGGPGVLCMPVTHSGLLVSARVAQEVCHFLAHGTWLGAP